MIPTVNVNLVHVLVAAIAAFALGALWYGPLFGKTWMKLAGVTPQKTKSMKKSMMKSMAGGFILTLLSSYILAHFVKYVSAASIGDASQLAFWLWLGFVVPVEAGVVLWEGKQFKLFAVCALHSLVSLALMASIIAAWV